jgi:5-methyltetrahydrofolate--homocysteine methyltransferase
VPYIDWTPFFQTWELKGRYPAILEDARQGEAARQLWTDAQAMLKRIVDERWFQAKGVVGFWPAQAVGDDIRLYTGESRSEDAGDFLHLRQQLSRQGGKPNLALSDFLAPQGGKADWIGGFVVSTGFGEERIAERLTGQNDDYAAIMAKALADRLAEAFAERMHERVRTEFWGYAADESVSREGLIQEEYQRHPPCAGLSRPA